jgi:hypothetical protein
MEGFGGRGLDYKICLWRIKLEFTEILRCGKFSGCRYKLTI